MNPIVLLEDINLQVKKEKSDVSTTVKIKQETTGKRTRKKVVKPLRIPFSDRVEFVSEMIGMQHLD